MNFTINGETTAMPDCPTVQALLKALGYCDEQKIAVAVNLEFVPRSAHETFALSEGDDIEIVAPMQGG